MNRFLTVLMAALLTLALCIPVSAVAAGGLTPGSITLNAGESATINYDGSLDANQSFAAGGGTSDGLSVSGVSASSFRISASGSMSAGSYSVSVVLVNSEDSSSEPIGSVAVTIKKAAEPEPVPVDSVKLDQTSLSLQLGGASATLTATVSPDNAADKKLSWASSDTSVATVSGGKVTPVGAGSCTVTATAGGKSAQCSVTVAAADVTEVVLSQSTMSMTVGGKTRKLTAQVKPDTAANRNVTWYSSNEKVATVKGGVVTAVSEGSATITAASVQNPDIAANCKVTVEKKHKHSWKKVKTVAATCTKSGYIKYECSCSETKKETLKKLYHWFGAWSCAGSDTHSAHCRREGCKHSATVSCAQVTAMSGDTVFTVCPVCGRISASQPVFAQDIAMVALPDAQVSSDLKGDGVVFQRALEDGRHVLLSINWEYGGKLRDTNKSCAVSIPLKTEKTAAKAVTLNLNGHEITSLTLLDAQGKGTDIAFIRTADKLSFEAPAFGLYMLTID